MDTRSVLLVSADVKLQRSLHNALLRNGVQCYASISLRDAVRTLESFRMDAVVFDSKLRVNSSPTSLADLAAAFPNVHRVLISGGAQGCNSAHAEAVVLRPVDISELLSALGSVETQIDHGLR